MQPGRGDGSDGKAVNGYWVNDGACHWLGNVSPALQSYRDWGAARAPAAPASMAKAKALKWFPGLRVP
jgi:hypothetical protein